MYDPRGEPIQRDEVIENELLFHGICFLIAESSELLVCRVKQEEVAEEMKCKMQIVDRAQGSWDTYGKEL